MASSGGGVRGVLCFGASGGGVDRGLALRVKMRHVRGSGPFPRATRPGKLCFGGWGWAARPPRPPPPPRPARGPPTERVSHALPPVQLRKLPRQATFPTQAQAEATRPPDVG